MRITIVRTVALGTITALGLAGVAFIPASSTATPTPHLAVLTEPIVQVPVRRAA
jgi:hypothetical protein